MQSLGWDYGQVSAGNPTDYVIDDTLIGGETLAATLDWFVNRSFDPDTLEATDVSFDDLDLQVFIVVVEHGAVQTHPAVREVGLEADLVRVDDFGVDRVLA